MTHYFWWLRSNDDMFTSLLLKKTLPGSARHANARRFVRCFGKGRGMNFLTMIIRQRYHTIKKRGNSGKEVENVESPVDGDALKLRKINPDFDACLNSVQVPADCPASHLNKMWWRAPGFRALGWCGMVAADLDESVSVQLAVLRQQKAPQV